jgi:hypothetical protein
MPDLLRLTLWDDAADVGPVTLADDGSIEQRADLDAIEVPMDSWRRAELPGDTAGYKVVATDADGVHHHATVDTHRRQLGHVRLLVRPVPMLGPLGATP